MRWSGSVVGSALATLTCLRDLVISGGKSRTDFDSVQPLLDACTHLRDVSRLGLLLPGVTVTLLAAAVPAMPALKSVSLAEEYAASGGLQSELKVLQNQFPSVVFRARSEV